ncbi:MAG: hypothetical protein KBB75_02770 [Candidatus Pacebacteria bacterium]|nr:hypothetical protein [Candidatus Paceibacterota bacterium]
MNEMISFLKDNGYVSEVRIYEDTRHVTRIHPSDVPDAVSEWMPFFVNFLQSPILIDGYEDNVNGVVKKDFRKERRASLREKDVALYQFYESNKLHASNISYQLFILDMIHESCPMNIELKKEFDEIVAILCSDPTTHFVDQYIVLLNNTEKLNVVNRLTRCIEDILLSYSQMKRTCS